MKLLMMFLLLHIIIVIQAAPAGSDTARRASIAESSVIMTQGTYPDSSSMGNSMSFSSNMLESGSTAAGSATSITTAPTVTSLTAPTANDELFITCMLKTFNIDETSLKVYIIGIILATSFAAIALIIVGVLTCSVGICIKMFARKNCGYSEKLSYLPPNIVYPSSSLT